MCVCVCARVWGGGGINSLGFVARHSSTHTLPGGSVCLSQCQFPSIRETKQLACKASYNL